MGAINYNNNKLFNLGLNVFDYEKQCEIQLKEMIEEGIIEFNNVEIDEFNYECISVLYEDCEYILNKYDFNYYNIKLESGYYEGFYLSIDFNYNYFNDFIEKQQAQKELTQVKKCFLELINCGLVSYHAWWCSSYYSKEETISMLNEFVKTERKRIADTLTDKFITWEFITKGIFTRTQLKELK